MSDAKVVKRGETNITRITLLEDDGSETIINVTDKIHFLFSYAQVDRKLTGVGQPMEILIKGDPEVCGEMFYQMGRNHPRFIAYVALKALERQSKDMTLDKILRDVEPQGGVN